MKYNENDYLQNNENEANNTELLGTYEKRSDSTKKYTDEVTNWNTTLNLNPMRQSSRYRVIMNNCNKESDKESHYIKESKEIMESDKRLMEDDEMEAKSKDDYNEEQKNQ